jgi:hypothetical protein
VGDYPIQVSQGTLSSANYTFNLTNGTLTVIEVSPVLTINYVADPEGQTNYVVLYCAGVAPGGIYHVQASVDLQQWAEIATTQAAQDGTITYVDTDVLPYPVRFYRLSGN